MLRLNIVRSSERHGLRAKTVLRLRIVSGVTLLSAIVGAVYGLHADPTAANTMVGALVGAFNGLTISSLEVFLQGPAAGILRRLSLLPVLVLRTLLYGAVFLGAGMLAERLVDDLLPESLHGGMVMEPNLPFDLMVALGFNIVFLLSALLGPRVLIALATGRYRRPRPERRVVLFLDLHGSTGHAERLGDEKFHSLLNEVFFDISEPVLASGGEIYRYVGDEIIITWPLDRGVRQAACVTCFFAIEDVLKRRRDDYRRRFAAEPRLRGALHAGTLVVGEMGDRKREIVMIGDTMNTAARIEEACRTTGRDFLASEAVLDAIPRMPAEVRTEALGEIALRGKEGDVSLYALSRA